MSKISCLRFSWKWQVGKILSSFLFYLVFIFICLIHFLLCFHLCFFHLHHHLYGGSALKNPLPIQETQVWSLCWEGLLEKKMAAHSSILALKIPWKEEPGRLQSKGSQRATSPFTLSPFSLHQKGVLEGLWVIWKGYVCVSHSVMSYSLQSHELWSTRLLCPWDFPGKSTRVGCHFLLQGIFLTQGSNPSLLHCRQTLYPLSHQGSPPI